MKIKTLVLAVFILSTLSLNSAFAGFMAVARVSKVSGVAFINKEKIAEGAEIAEGMEVTLVKPHDYIEIKFQNGHVVRLTGAHVKVVSLNPKETFFNLLKGKIYSAIKPLTTDEKFTIKTKSVSFAVRGTRFYVDESKKGSYLCVCEGVVAAKGAQGEASISKDEDLLVANGKSEIRATIASKKMLDNTNSVFKEMGVL